MQIIELTDRNDIQIYKFCEHFVYIYLHRVRELMSKDNVKNKHNKIYNFILYYNDHYLIKNLSKFIFRVFKVDYKQKLLKDKHLRIIVNTSEIYTDYKAPSYFKPFPPIYTRAPSHKAYSLDLPYFVAYSVYRRPADVVRTMRAFKINFYLNKQFRTFINDCIKSIMSRHDARFASNIITKYTIKGETA